MERRDFAVAAPRTKRSVTRGHAIRHVMFNGRGIRTRWWFQTVARISARRRILTLMRVATRGRGGAWLRNILRRGKPSGAISR
ncbi:hypothetical protein GCM10011410_27520 [Hoyosella rhizosphaerae]|uniref:Uncharacterized protein n=1 Tax=Hoyosella rhizosphaerae TaxID=1755582 RepID=A0A916UHV6_9ACTN|nr:hypothetical protein GCM10011410_27520 [Hoyosella rhizosphaerae]